MSYRQAILDTALELFAERGFSRTSISELARITGVAEGTIFHHFKNKDGLFIAVLEHVRQTFVDAVNELQDDTTTTTGLELFERIIELYFTLSENKPNEFKLLFRGYTYKLASANPIGREHIETTYETFANALAEAIELGTRDGSIRPVQAEAQAMLVLSMLSGVVRFKSFHLWTSTRSYSDAIEFFKRGLIATGSKDGDT